MKYINIRNNRGDDKNYGAFERGRCAVCGWSCSHSPGCPTIKHRPSTLHPLITVGVLEDAFAVAEAHWAKVRDRDDHKSATTIRAFVWEAAPILVAPLVARIAELESQIKDGR